MTTLKKSSELLDETAKEITSINPNPSNGIINAAYESWNNSNVQLIIYDLMGKVVFNKADQAFKGTNSFSLDLSHLNSGVYLLAIKNWEHHQ